MELEEIRSDKYNAKEQVEAFIQNNGQILACGTCLKSRNKTGTAVCPISTMKDLLGIIEESDKVVSFG